MVRVTVIGHGYPNPVVLYDDHSDTDKVKKDLQRGYGMGILHVNGKGVLSPTLVGDYEYEKTMEETPHKGLRIPAASGPETPSMTAETARLIRGVVILMVGSKRERLAPTGLAFAVGPRHFLTVSHNITKKDKMIGACSSIVGSQGFGARMLQRTNAEGKEHDWLLLELMQAEPDSEDYLSLAPLGSIPHIHGAHCRVRALHATVRQFLRNTVSSLHVQCESFHRVLGYEPLPSDETINPAAEKIIKMNKGPAPDPRDDPNNVVMTVEGSLSAGASGCPYVNEEGQVVAIHLQSLNDGVTLREVWSYLKKVQEAEGDKGEVGEKRAASDFDHESWDEVSQTYGDSKVGLVIAKVPKLVEALRNANIVI